MRDLDLTTLRLFVTVCETRNIVRASEQASLVGSAISKRLSALEEAVGVKLLQRRRRGMEPTAAGQTLLEHAREMLATAERIERAMAGYASGLRGEVRVLASASALAEHLADDIAAFLALPVHKDIRVTMEERVSPDIVRGIREGSASLGVCWDAADLGDLASTGYRSDELAVAVHRSHPLAHRKRVRFVETLDYEQVVLPVNSAVNLLLGRAAAAAGRRLQHRVVVTSFDAALRAVLANLALSVVPREVAAPYRNSPDLCVVRLDEAWAKRRFAICYRGIDTLPNAARLLIEHLQRAAQTHGGPSA